ncbi:hypothetical protein [Sinorhizobium sp. BG8]|uniref:ImuA family protein n=1 Tax=Sinorhizobium sp. BG8 TaxID=2613773 RepID=UPI00193CD841|nr:hypothetical protein [Sinorhizobium sp. BG8]
MAGIAAADERLFALREAVARLEGHGMPERRYPAPDRMASPSIHCKTPMARRITLGVPFFDADLCGGMAIEGLTEIRNAETRDAGAAMGFTTALAVVCQEASRKDNASALVLWIVETAASREAGMPYGVGLETFGLDTSRFLLTCPRRTQDALWIAEAALSTPAFSAVVLEVRGNPACFGLSESRRLHLRARASGIPLLLLRQNGAEEASSALLRLHVRPAAAAERILHKGHELRGSLGNPVFHVTAEKSRTLAPDGILLEWNSRDRRFSEFNPAAHAAPAKPAHPRALLSPSGGRPDIEAEMGRVVAFSRAS